MGVKESSVVELREANGCPALSRLEAGGRIHKVEDEVNVWNRVSQLKHVRIRIFSTHVTC